MTTGSLLGFVLWASFGAVTVLVGLLMEALSEKKLFNNIGSFRRCESIKKWGEWVVIGGIVVEISVGIVLAISEWQHEPLNQPIRTISADVFFVVKGGDFVETDVKSFFHGRMASVALLNICETNDQASNLMPGSLYAQDFTVGFLSKDVDSDRMYSLKFESKWAGSGHPVDRPAKEILKAKQILILPWFLPQNVKILSGSVRLLVNSEIPMDFQIPLQYNNQTNSFSPLQPMIFATNSGKATPSFDGFELWVADKILHQADRESVSLRWAC